jgi:hypothetical protein
MHVRNLPPFLLIAFVLGATSAVGPASAVDGRAAVAIFGPHFWPQNLTITWTEGPIVLTFANPDKAVHLPASGPHDGFVMEAKCFAVDIPYHEVRETTLDPSNPACASPIYYHCHIHPIMQGNLTLQWVP